MDAMEFIPLKIGEDDLDAMEFIPLKIGEDDLDAMQFIPLKIGEDDLDAMQFIPLKIGESDIPPTPPDLCTLSSTMPAILLLFTPSLHPRADRYPLMK
jgi:hypothetical protein